MILDIMDFGAVGNGTTNDTFAVRAAMEAAASTEGKTVVRFPSGHIFKTGYVRVFGKTEILLEEGSIWKASDNLDDFLPEGGHFSYTESKVPSFTNSDYNGGPPLKFIHALGAEDISFSGTGIIDGNEPIFHGKQYKDHIEGLFYPRAPLLYIENVRSFSMQDVILQNSAFWTVHLVGCKDVFINKITISNNLSMANCDGIDPDGCENVTIKDCRITSADDCIVLKNTVAAQKYDSCRNIRISGCTLESKSAAIKIGSESESLFTDIEISNCTVLNSNRAVSLQLRDKGSIENLYLHDMKIETRLYDPENWWGKAEAVAITANRRYPSTNVGHIQNIVFERISAEAENGIIIIGDEEKNNIRDIRFSDCSFHLRKKTAFHTGVIDTRPGVGNRLKTGSPLRHVTIEHASEIQFENVTFSADESMSALLAPDADKIIG
ncbi:MAG: right-handed parallel beta-helix repeat-containing protein [Clostridia bacterium]|nr:right-handed parallel beta-helix repeat-containing protein [Clostridia bacterium]